MDSIQWLLKLTIFNRNQSVESAPNYCLLIGIISMNPSKCGKLSIKIEKIFLININTINRSDNTEYVKYYAFRITFLILLNNCTSKIKKYSDKKKLFIYRLILHTICEYNKFILLHRNHREIKNFNALVLKKSDISTKKSRGYRSQRGSTHLCTLIKTSGRKRANDSEVTPSGCKPQPVTGCSYF